jgi:hypothetical protein
MLGNTYECCFCLPFGSQRTLQRFAYQIRMAARKKNVPIAEELPLLSSYLE